MRMARCDVPSNVVPLFAFGGDAINAWLIEARLHGVASQPGIGEARRA
jgi:hypothetical protein